MNVLWFSSIQIIFIQVLLAIESTIKLATPSSSSSTDIAYTHPPYQCKLRRSTNCYHLPSASSASRSFLIQKGPLWGRYMHITEDGGSYLQQNPDVSYRPVRQGDISRCHEIEAASYPEDEAASLEMLSYRQQSASDYFWCATFAKKDDVIGFICSTRCHEFTEESMSTHDPNGSILAIHSVVVDSPYRRKGIASAMIQNYMKKMLPHSNLVANTRNSGFCRVLLLAKSHLLSFYVDNGFMVLRPSPIVHGKETWYELEARQDYLEQLIRVQESCTENVQMQSTTATKIFESSRSTSNPYEGEDGNAVVAAVGRDRRRTKLHAELVKLGIDPIEMEAHPLRFGTAAMRTYNSFLLPKSAGALAVAESPTRARVVANNISFLEREYKADREEWLRNVDRNRRSSSTGDAAAADPNLVDGAATLNEKYPIIVILDNIRSAHNVGNILRLAEAAQVDSVCLCGITPRPPHPKVLKTAMGAAEHVSLSYNDDVYTTLQAVLDVKSKGYKVFGVETTQNSSSLWDMSIPDDDEGSESIAFVFGNELIGVDVQVLRECDAIISLPTYGIKNSLNVATCVGIVLWDTLRRLSMR